MSDREAHRFDHLSDGHLADKAAYGDSGAFVALADRFGDRVWTVAALAAADEGTATRATARAFTRTLAGVAAGIGDPDARIERALVAAAFELAVAARIDVADLADRLPTPLRTEDPATRVALWLTAQGWSEADALAAVAADAPAAPSLEASPAAREAATALDLTVPAGLAAATTDGWHEWQGIGLTIPDRHPLTAVLSRLDSPLGRMGDALGRAAGSRTTRRRRARATAAASVSVAATPPPPLLLPIGAEPDPEPAPALTPAPAVAVEPAPAAVVDDVDHDATASGSLLGHRTGELDLPERRSRPRPRHLATAGSTPNRTRVLAALAAGILTASAMGSLLTTTPTDVPGARADQVAAGAPGADSRGEGTLLDDRAMVPAANITEGSGSTEAGTRSPAGATAGTPTGSSAAPRDAARPSAPSGGGSTGGVPSAGGTSPGGAPSGSGGSSGGGTGTDAGGPAPTTPGTSPAPPTTATPPPATTEPAPTTTTPPTTTPPPPTTPPPGPVCTLLPILCPGGGLVP